MEIDALVVDKLEMIQKNSNENKIVNFGKYKGEKWCNVPLHYLKWIYSENEHRLAYEEIKRRKYTPINVENQTISTGRYKGDRWIDLPTNYLEWMMSRFEEEHENHKFAKAVLSKRINNG